MRRTCLAVPLAVALLAAPALADTLTRKDGTTLDGRLDKVAGGWTVTPADGPPVFVASSDVKGVTLTGGGGPADAGRARQRLASLRRAAGALDDPADAVARYDRLVDQLAGDDPDVAAARAEAEADRAAWRARAEGGLVKVGDDWVTPDERAQLAVNRLATAAQVRDYLKQGRDDAASQLLDAALRQNPDDESALYLQGVMLYRRGDLAQARRRFERVNEIAPNHAPTLNNLAAIALQQRQPARAAKTLLDAITAAPVNRQLLDNAAELLDALPERDRDDRPARLLADEFERQDALLADQLSAQGLRRWGGTWVGGDERREIDAARVAADERIAALQRDFDLTQELIVRIDQDLDRTRRTLESMRQQSAFVDADGAIRFRPLPAAYYDVERDLNRLQRDRADQAARIDALRAAAAEARDAYPRPRFEGTLQLVGEDGVPIVLPPGAEVPADLVAPPTDAASGPATTEPTTRPATP